MALGSVKIIKKLPSPQQQFKFIQDQIKRELVPVAQAHVDERDKVVSDWDTEVKFGYRISATEKQVTLTIVVENENEQVGEGEWTVGDLWRALDSKGTKSHTIKPKSDGGRLSFQWGGPSSYQPKTRPIARSGGPGTVSNPQRVAFRSVNHPGFPARKFSQVINKKLRGRFEKAIGRGIRLGSRKRR